MTNIESGRENDFLLNLRCVVSILLYCREPMFPRNLQFLTSLDNKSNEIYHLNLISLYDLLCDSFPTSVVC